MARKRVLVAVGDPDWKKELCAILHKKCCDVHTTEDGFEGIELVRNHKFALVIADESLDQAGPIELALNIRDMKARMPVLVVTGSGLERYNKVWKHCEVFFAGTRRAALGKISEALKAASEADAVSLLTNEK